ncbi:hypothetical protein KUCAC02_013769, partial [Chaenocephalus aceratus]
MWYGMDCLIQFEDFANVNAFRLLSKYRNKYCMFNDDIQGTAAVAVAGLLAALRITKSKMCDHTIVFQGAGEAAMGIAELITMAMEKEGLAKEECLKKIWMVDSKGLIVKGRDSLTHEKERFAHEHPQMRKLEDVVHELKPTAIIGVAAIAGAFTEQIIADMASFNERPIIFALSNPTSKAECTAEQCYTITQGRGIFASGSPFDPITLSDGRTFYPGQGNNAYIFPGVGLGVIACAVRHITEEIFLTSAEALADLVTEKDLAEGRLYPPLSSIREVSLKLAVKIIEYAYKHNMATLYPEPSDKKAYVHSLTYSTDYDEFAVASYSWPEDKARQSVPEAFGWPAAQPSLKSIEKQADQSALSAERPAPGRETGLLSYPLCLSLSSLSPFGPPRHLAGRSQAVNGEGPPCDQPVCDPAGLSGSVSLSLSLSLLFQFPEGTEA